MTATQKTLLKFSTTLALLLVAYLPTLVWMYDRWMMKESEYGHGILIPIVSAVIIWQRRSKLAKIKISGEMAGIWIVAVGLIINIVCASLKVSFVSGFSLVFVLYGLILFFFGKEMGRSLIFPVFFLLAMVPLPLVVVSNLTVKLKLIATQCAMFILNHIGFPCIQDGSIIRMPNSFIAVEAPCSGLRSLVSLLTLGVIFAYSMKTSYVKKTALFLSSIPIAMATNVLRITMLAVVNDLYGQKIAMGFFHDMSGFLVFGVAFVALLGVSKALEDR